MPPVPGRAYRRRPDGLAVGSQTHRRRPDGLSNEARATSPSRPERPRVMNDVGFTVIPWCPARAAVSNSSFLVYAQENVVQSSTSNHHGTDKTDCSSGMGPATPLGKRRSRVTRTAGFVRDAALPCLESTRSHVTGAPSGCHPPSSIANTKSHPVCQRACKLNGRKPRPATGIERERKSILSKRRLLATMLHRKERADETASNQSICSHLYHVFSPAYLADSVQEASKRTILRMLYQPGAEWCHSVRTRCGPPRLASFNPRLLRSIRFRGVRFVSLAIHPVPRRPNPTHRNPSECAAPSRLKPAPPMRAHDIQPARRRHRPRGPAASNPNPPSSRTRR